MMKEFNKKVSNLIFNLEAKDAALNALWIEEFEMKYMDHKILIYKTLKTLLMSDVLDVNQVVHRDDQNEDALRWYLITSGSSHEPFCGDMRTRGCKIVGIIALLLSLYVRPQCRVYFINTVGSYIFDILNN